MFNYPAGARAAYAMDNPPVVRVVVQVAYPPAARLGTSEAIAELQERLPKGFRLQQQQATVGFHISFGTVPGLAPAATTQFTHPGGFELSVNPDSLALAIDHRYRDRTAFATMLEPVLAVVGAAGRLKDYVRLGVRYINAAPATIGEFCAWFKPEFVGWAGGDVVAPDTEHRTWVLITQIVQNRAELPVTHGIVRYGYLQGGVGADITKSAAASAPSFIADIDLGDQRPGLFEPGALTDHFRVINHEIAAFFENSMTSEGIAHFALRSKEA